MQLIPTILCGGAGSRLWPVSRALHPKPFIRLNDGQSLLQKAFLRAGALPGVTDILTVTNRELFFKIEDEYTEINRQMLSTAYVLEPVARNTAPAIASAARYVEQTYGLDAVLLILAADHLIDDGVAFQSAVQDAMCLAQKGYLTTFGITPEHPETGYGYIKINKEKPLAAGFSIQQFIEKPTFEHAQNYLSSGHYLWNAGLFCFTAGAVLDQMKAVCPELLAAVDQCLAVSKKERSIWLLDPERFQSVPSISFDYAVMEPSTGNDQACTAVVPCTIGWNDIGSWSALGDLETADAQGNRLSGDVIVKDTTNCTIKSYDRFIGTVGIDHLVIIDTADALLVAHRDQVQHVKEVYERLQEVDHEVHKLHRTVHRPWGTYTVLEDGERFKIKRIEVKPGGRLSLQMHHHRSEHWIVVQGMAKVTNGEQIFLVRTNESTYIPAGHQHRLENPGLLPLVMIEVQSGEYLGEDDIVRFQDEYGRVPA